MTYTDLVTEWHKEMDKTIPFKDINTKTTKKGLRGRQKPFWNPELSDLWKKACTEEKKYLKCKGPRREHEQRRTEFKQARRRFDNSYRKAEREYRKEQGKHISNLRTDNPKEFWQAIKNLGPGKQRDTVSGVKLEDGSISLDPNIVLQK